VIGARLGREPRWVVGRFGVGAASVLLIAATPLPAQARFNYWVEVDRALQEIGGVERLGTARPEQRTRLANLLLERGQTYLDLYEFERLLVRDHALMRDSIARSGGGASHGVAYVLARAYQELGRDREALTWYRAVRGGAPAEVRAAATAWAATLGGGTSNSWQQDVVQWRLGRSVRPGNCPSRAVGCALLRAIAMADGPAIVRLQREMSRDREPDVVDTVVSATGRSTLELFDPITPYLLAMADYTVAELALRDVPRSEPARGVALLRLRRFGDAVPVLTQAAAGAGNAAGSFWALVGEALVGAGRREEGERAFQRAGSGGGAANVVADARAATLQDATFATRQYATERARGLDRLRGGAEGGVFLARALLRVGKAAEALDVLEGVRPLSAGDNLSVVRPYVLVLASWAQYLVGNAPGMRHTHAPSRGDLAALANVVPSARPAHSLLQQLTAPTEFPAAHR